MLLITSKRDWPLTLRDSEGWSAKLVMVCPSARIENHLLWSTIVIDFQNWSREKDERKVIVYTRIVPYEKLPSNIAHAHAVRQNTVLGVWAVQQSKQIQYSIPNTVPICTHPCSHINYVRKYKPCTYHQKCVQTASTKTSSEKNGTPIWNWINL